MESPTAALTFAIRDWFAWKPGRETRADWLLDVPAVGLEGSSDWASAPIPALPMMLRRRMGAFDQKVVGAALAMPAAAAARYVFATRHGEFATTLRILENLHLREMPSPADFSLSVHHALAGLLSIQTHNKAGHTTVSAGRDTFGYGLLEAVAAVADQPAQSVLLVSYDEALPEIYRKFRDADEAALPLIVVLEITAGDAGGSRFALHTVANEAESPDLAEETEGDIDPMGQRFLEFFLSDRAQGRLQGETLTWILDRA